MAIFRIGTRGSPLALTQAAMKLGQAMYEQQQAEAGAGADANAEGAGAGEQPNDDVVDAEFSEVDEGENKG